MLMIEFHAQFKKDYKLAKKQGCDLSKLDEVVLLLAGGKPLPERNRDHALSDSRLYKGVRECHIEPYWLLIYKICDGRLILELLRTGSHADLIG